MELADILPARTPGDVLAGVVRVRLGGVDYTLPVLTIAENREWQAALDATLGRSIADVPGDDAGGMIEAAMATTDGLLDQLIAYDRTGVLPSREQIEATARPHELLMATLEVWAAASPLLGMALANMTASATTTSTPRTSSRRTNGARPHANSSAS